MASSLSAVAFKAASLRKVTRALLSVSDKRGIVELGSFLSSNGVELLSTGGTAKVLREAGVPLRDVSDFTGFPEMFDGRVKTLHPKIHGGLLAVRGNDEHLADMHAHDIDPIDMVVVNLYPFSSTVAMGSDFDTCIENIDIGGPSMLRSSAKNHNAVVVLTSPDQYDSVVEEMSENSGATTLETRRRLASQAFALSASYDASIASWFSSQLGTDSVPVTRTYTPELSLKYGCNPQQKPAFLGTVDGASLPFKVVNGSPGYINLCDASNAWQLVRELREAVGLPAATSFKHVSPAGAAVATPLPPSLASIYETGGKELTPVATAYLRARNADPLCSFGDFAAVSDVVDEATAKILKPEVSDGIIAPGYEPAALEILKKKKGGNFIILEADPELEPPIMEYRELHGMVLAQRRNDAILTKDSFTSRPTLSKDLPDTALIDLLVASITLKYTQSNSVGYAIGGQMIGVGAGQQSRVDCVKLAGRKLQTWYLRQHPKVMGLKFKPGVKRQNRVNARVRYIEGDFSDAELRSWLDNFEEEPEPLTAEEKAEFMSTLSGVCVSSDAFFPFRDSIDVASKLGVTYIAQPGGSVADDQVISACDEYGMTMAFTGLRLFHH